MKKLVLLVCLLAITVGLFAAGTTEAAKDDGVLDIRALIWKYDDTYGSTVRAAMEKWVKNYEKELGLKIKFTMYDAADDMAKQIEQATIICGEKPDFVIINLAEVTNGQVLVDMFQESKIPFLFYNKQPADQTTKSVLVDTKTIFIGTLARQAGDMQGQILYDLYKADPKIDKNGDGILQYIMFMGEPQNDEAIARSRYSVETAKSLGLKMEAVTDTLVCNWDQAQAQEAMTATWASVGKKIEVIIVNNDMMGLGAVAALNAYGYNTGKAGDPKIVVIGVDAIDAALESIKNGGMTATVQQDGDAMGKANIRIAINGALGKEWLDGTTYKYTTEDAFHCIRIPYAMITSVK
jgi:methyl-galactoside transport system substrate-binding protein